MAEGLFALTVLVFFVVFIVKYTSKKEAGTPPDESEGLPESV